MMLSNVSIYKVLYRIRRFEETVLENFARGVFFGTTHTYLGQEANAVGVLTHIHGDDVVFSNHRGHGHFLAYGGDMRSLFAEMMGKKTGVCGGRGGSQHLHWRNFYSNGVQGGIVPVATGMALAEKLNTSDALVVAFLGDGTLGEGVVYEALNLASLWQLPILYIVENNRIAQTTPVETALAGDIISRFGAFGISAEELRTSDVLEISSAASELLGEVRKQRAPQALILQTFRFAPHSKGDDTRPEDEIAQMRADNDPLQIHGVRLTSDERMEIESAINKEINGTFQQALADPLPDPADLQ